MDNKELYETLYHMDIFENSYRDIRDFETIFRMEKTKIQNDNVFLFNMLSADIVELSKQPRGVYIPKHIHSYIEISYVFSGTCKHSLNGKEIILNKGEILVIDENVIHESYAANIGDITINIMINKQYITPELLEGLCQGSLLQEFFLRTNSKYSGHANYILYNNNFEQNKLDNIMEIMLTEYYSSSENSKSIISTCLCLLLQCLSKQNDEFTNMVPKRKKSRSRVSCNEIVEYIKNNYQDCTLRKLEAHFGFNPNYLSNILKINTGKSFKEILTKEKFQHALVLIDETELPISEIMYIVGISNASYFYRKFEEIYHIELKDYRKNKR